MPPTAISIWDVAPAALGAVSVVTNSSLLIVATVTLVVTGVRRCGAGRTGRGQGEFGCADLAADLEVEEQPVPARRRCLDAEVHVGPGLGDAVAGFALRMD